MQLSSAHQIRACLLILSSTILCCCRNTATPSTPAPGPSQEAESSASQSFPSARVPINYFEFASDSRITPARVYDLAKKYDKNVMIGADSGNADSNATMPVCSAAAALWLGRGRGGPGEAGHRGSGRDGRVRRGPDVQACRAGVTTGADAG